jgi:hypothetical protein
VKKVLASYVTIFIGVLLTLVVEPSAMGQGPYLVRDGKANAVLILPANASTALNFAAEELNLHIKKMSGTILPVVTEGDPANVTGPRVYLGSTNTASQRGISVCGTMDDAFRIETNGGDLFLIGKGDRGSLYSVYEFLEQLGVRWIMPSELGVMVPARKDIALKNWMIAQEPDIHTRINGVHLTSPEFIEELNLWTVRMRCNAGFNAKWSEKIGGSVGSGRTGHNYRSLIDLDLYDSHPEYFSLLDGKREDPRTTRYWKMCLSNPDVRRIAVEKTITYLQANPQIDFFSLMPTDGRRWCQCEECKKLQDDKTNQSGPVFDFACHIIERVASRFPNVLFPVSSYGDYTLPPKGFQPPKGLMLRVVLHGNYSRPVTDPANKKMMDILDAWKPYQLPLAAYFYTWKMAYKELPWPLFRPLVEDIRLMRDHGTVMAYFQSGGQNWGSNGLQYYMGVKALWDVDMNVDKVYLDYCCKGYGPAAESIEKYYNTLWQAWLSESAPTSQEIVRVGPGRVDKLMPQIYSQTVLEKTRTHLNDAYNQAKNRPDVLARLDLLRVSQTYTEKYIPLRDGWTKYLAHSSVAPSPHKLLSMAQDLMAYIEHAEKKSPWALTYRGHHAYTADVLPTVVIEQLSGSKNNNKEALYQPQ